MQTLTFKRIDRIKNLMIAHGVPVDEKAEPLGKSLYELLCQSVYALADARDDLYRYAEQVTGEAELLMNEMQSGKNPHTAMWIGNTASKITEARDRHSEAVEKINRMTYLLSLVPTIEADDRKALQNALQDAAFSRFG